ncbi:MAG: hypothetical protein Q7U44_02890 [Desulfuromonadales bacterium]|nr:hypothetical protein [Desulfuromonadales bacterium]
MPIVVNNSNYALINLTARSGWMELTVVCGEYLLGKDHQALFSYLKDDAKTVIVEKKYVDKDYRDTFSQFYSKKFAQYPSTSYRLHFFRSTVTMVDLFELSQHKDEYIGYAVIRPTQINSIGRTIFAPEKIAKLKGLICQTKYKAHLFGTELEIKGFPYISQDTDVTICAHAATWMTLRYFSERYSTYREIFPYEISQFSGDVSHGRLVPSKGLTAFEITEIFARCGFYPEVYLRNTYEKKGDASVFYRILYYYIESGIPVVACLHEKRHAVTLIGHVSDYSKEFTGNSEGFLTGYVINDDNCLPYQLVMRQGEGKEGYCSCYHVEDIDGFIVPLYEKMYLSAEHIEGLTDGILEHPVFGVNKRSKLVSKENLIKRIFLTSSKSYKAFRRSTPLSENLHQAYVELAMPKFIWVCELSTAEHYSLKKVVGEILFDATANHKDKFSFLAIHYPDFILFNDRNKLGDSRDRFAMAEIKTDQLESYAMYENNLKEI